MKILKLLVENDNNTIELSLIFKLAIENEYKTYEISSILKLTVENKYKIYESDFLNYTSEDGKYSQTCRKIGNDIFEITVSGTLLNDKYINNIIIEIERVLKISFETNSKFYLVHNYKDFSSFSVVSKLNYTNWVTNNIEKSIQIH